MNYSPALADAHRRYQGFRDAAFHYAYDEMTKHTPSDCILAIREVDAKAISLAMANISLGYSHKNGGFQWDLIWRQVRSTPRRFDVSVWDGSFLCGLAIGMASRGKQNVTIKWMERFNSYEALPKGQFRYHGFYRGRQLRKKSLGSQWLMVRDPLPGTERLYMEHGFSLAPQVSKVAYYQREVR